MPLFDERNNTPEHCGKPMQRVVSIPHVIEDMKPYISPLDGKVVSSRTEHRNKMVEHDVVEVGNEPMTRPATKESEPEGIKQDLYDAFTRAGI